jgi:hypothetical protein
VVFPSALRLRPWLDFFSHQFPATHLDTFTTEQLAMSTNKGDVAAHIVGSEAQTYDHSIERRIIRKIDLWVIPFLWLGYGLCVLNITA